MAETFDGQLDTGVKVKDVMTHGVITVKKTDSLQKAAARFLRKNIDALFIVVDGKPKGVITKSDILERAVSGEDLNSIQVKDVMHSPVRTVSVGVDVSSAIKVMRDFNVTKLGVVEGSKLAGVITQEDFVKVTPALFDLIYELGAQGRKIGGAEEAMIEREARTGFCESCGQFSESLMEYDAKLLCVDCKSSQESLE
ncbi:MAG: CBS domain-containing protein [Candidatus Diapherotrites archaeon]|nr:CBS domain-containing protein [Candidatus Diapherotrites archaeon]